MKKLLIQDWELVQSKQILKLPRKPTVAQILDEFGAQRKGKNPASQGMTQEIVNGLKDYFDHALRSVLLYRFERPQYQELVQDETDEKKDRKNMCDFYGAEHLLRLFVKLPGLLVHTKMDTTEKQVLQARLTDIIRWLQKKQNYFGGEYYKPDEAYFLKVLPSPATETK